MKRILISCVLFASLFVVASAASADHPCYRPHRHYSRYGHSHNYAPGYHSYYGSPRYYGYSPYYGSSPYYGRGYGGISIYGPRFSFGYRF